MKRTLLMIMSILLAASSVFGIIAAGRGSDELSDIMRFKRGQKADIIELIDDFDARLAKFRKAEENRTEDEKDYTESVVTDQKGNEQLSQGTQEYNAGAAKIAAGQAEYDAAEKQYNEKLAEYQAAEKRLSEGEAQLNDAKAQRDAAQAKLDAATPAYQQAQQLFAFIDKHPALQIAESVLRGFGFTSLDEARAAMKEYEDGQAQLAEANAQISAAEQEINNGKTQLAAAKTQLDQGKEQLAAAKVQLDNGKAELAAAKNQLDAGQQQLNENADRVDEVRETLKQIDNDEEAVKFGVEELMKYDGIADLVTDTSDYESVSQAARDFIDSDTDKLNSELDVRQNLYNLLRIISIVGVLAGVIGVLASLKPNRTRIYAATGAAGIAAVASLVLNIYGLSNDYRSFVYSLEDGSGNGQTQLIAMLVLLAVSVIAAIVTVVCGRAYTDAVNGREREKYVRPSEAVAAAQPELDADEEDDDDEEPAPKPRRRDNKSKKHSAEKLEYTPEPDSIDELTEQTRRLNEEAEKLEAEARRNDYEKARREYEEARRRFEEARRRSEENK